MDSGRVILHVDMDAFFASVEQRDNPDLRGKPVLVGGAGRRGVVSAASYEARVFGCRSAMPTAAALRLCPHAIVVDVRGKRYGEVSAQVFDIFARYTSQIEPLSVDEAFLDVTGSRRLFGSGEIIAHRIRADIARELQLTASVGVAQNKFLAKLGSDLNKPDGMTLISPENFLEIIEPLPVVRVWGIGAKMAERLAGMNIRTIGDLRRCPPELFRRFFGSWSDRVRDLIDGRDDREVTPDHLAKSVGHEHTFEFDVSDTNILRGVLLDEVEQVAARLRKHETHAAGITLKLRYGDFTTITRARKLELPTHTTRDLWLVATAVFDEWARTSLAPLRLIGFAATSLSRGGQLGLFDRPASEKQSRLDSAVDRINARFGKRSVERGKESKPDT